MRRLAICFPFLIFSFGVLLFGCSDEETPTSNGSTAGSWKLVFEDHFDGDTLSTANWTQLFPSPPPYALTGNGELRIDGRDDGDGAAFLYNTAISGTRVRLTTKFRTTQIDPLEDDVDVLIVLNWDESLDNGYGLLLTSDLIGSVRDYTLSIVRVANGADSELIIENIGGTTPQITAGKDYTLEGVNDGGTIAFKIKDGGGNVLKSVSVDDASYSGAQCGFGGDLNASSPGSQSIFFDYVKIEK